MAFTNQEVRRGSIFLLIVALIILAIMILRPILLSVVAGLLLAYIFFPVYKRMFRLLKEKNTSALAVCVLIVAILFVPIWFIIPLIIQEAFDVFTFTQTINLGSFVENLFPAASDKFRQDTTTIIINFIGDVTNASLTALTDFLLDLPNVLLQGAVIIFVFFFALRDNERLRNFVAGLSPIRKDKEKIIVTRFKEITFAIVFGHIIVGVIQGIAMGIGLFIFKVPQALILTLLAILASVIPLVGPWLVWIPTAIYLLAVGKTGVAIAFAIYSAVIVSSIDNILRPYIVSKKTGVSSVIILIGMIGGLLVFGIIGLILGPLVLSYLIVLLEAYKDKTLIHMFHSD